MRETTWVAASGDEIRGLADRLAPLKGWRTAEFSWTRVASTTLRVHACSPSYLDYLVSNYSCSTLAEQTTETLTLFYDSGAKQRLWSALGRASSDIPQTPCVGLYAHEERLGLISGLDEYGLMKSTALGLHSRLLLDAGWAPIHGAVLQIAGCGVVLVGHHGAGKSTALLNLMARAPRTPPPLLATDDWAAAAFSQDQTSIELRPIDDRISFTRRLEAENPDLGLGSVFPSDLPEGINKAWVDINRVFPGSKTDRLQLDAVVVLSPIGGTQLLNSIDTDAVVSLLVDSAYHMPDCGAAVETLTAFWTKALRTRPALLVDSRFAGAHPSDIFTQVIDAVARL